MEQELLWVAGIVVALTTIIAAIIKLRVWSHNKFIKIRDWFNQPTKEELIALKKEFKDKDYRDCQTDILNFLKDVESVHKPSEVQVEHMCKIYTHYQNNLNGNTYIEGEWKRVMPLLNEERKKSNERKTNNRS